MEWHHHTGNIQKLKYFADEERSILLQLKLSLLQAPDHKDLSPFTYFDLFPSGGYQRELYLFPLTLLGLFFLFPWPCNQDFEVGTGGIHYLPPWFLKVLELRPGDCLTNELFTAAVSAPGC